MYWHCRAGVKKTAKAAGRSLPSMNQFLDQEKPVSTSQETGWEKHLRNRNVLFWVECDVKP